MGARFAAIAVIAGLHGFTAIQERPPHKWAPLSIAEGSRVEADTSSIEVTESVRRVWLRWHENTIRDRTQFRIERHEVDCMYGRTRILMADRVDVDALNGRVLRTAILKPDIRWSSPGSGSVAAQVLGALCPTR